MMPPRLTGANTKAEARPGPEKANRRKNSRNGQQGLGLGKKSAVSRISSSFAKMSFETWSPAIRSCESDPALKRVGSPEQRSQARAEPALIHFDEQVSGQNQIPYRFDFDSDRAIG